VSKENFSQSWDPERFDRNAGFVADLGAGVMEPLAPQAEERILDLGCGHGKLMEKLVACGTSVLAVDASAEQVKGARDRGLDAHVADATKLTFKCEFDAVFSNAVLHWVKDADAAIAGVKQALVPGGRFVGEFGSECFFNSVAAGDREALLDEVREDLAWDLKDADGNWFIDYARMRFHVFLP
jgi:SAM-dependent methyltransferase